VGLQCRADVRRVRNGKPATHPLRGDEIRALRELHRQFPESSFVFATERGGPFTSDAVNRLIKRIGERAGFPFPVHATCYGTAVVTRWRMQAMTRGL
jgi:integrase